MNWTPYVSIEVKPEYLWLTGDRAERGDFQVQVADLRCAPRAHETAFDTPIGRPRRLINAPAAWGWISAEDAARLIFETWSRA